MSKTDHQLRLATGRLLAYDEHGAADGTPIFYFHGSPSTRLEWHLFGSETLARKLSVRVIVPDRPGLGRSDFQPSRRISDWPADVIALADHLALIRFAVLGYSGRGRCRRLCAGWQIMIVTRTALGAGPSSLLFSRFAAHCRKPLLLERSHNP
jgi:Alpha/beta hydrolase family